MDVLDKASSPGSTPAPQADLNALQRECESLRHLVISILVLLIVISGAVNLFILRQTKYVQTDLKAVRPQVAQMLEEYNRTSAPLMNDFVQKLVVFGQKNSDFVPILLKYRLISTNPPAAAQAPAPKGPQPTQPAPTKK